MLRVFLLHTINIYINIRTIIRIQHVCYYAYMQQHATIIVIIIGTHNCYKLNGNSCITCQTVYTQMLIHLAEEQRNPLLLVTSGNYQDGG